LLSIFFRQLHKRHIFHGSFEPRRQWNCENIQSMIVLELTGASKALHFRLVRSFLKINGAYPPINKNVKNNVGHFCPFLFLTRWSLPKFETSRFYLKCLEEESMLFSWLFSGHKFFHNCNNVALFAPSVKVSKLPWQPKKRRRTLCELCCWSKEELASGKSSGYSQWNFSNTALAILLVLSLMGWPWIHRKWKWSTMNEYCLGMSRQGKCFTVLARDWNGCGHMG